MNPVNAQAVAETIMLGLEENDKIASTSLIEVGDPITSHIAVIGIETDTGELFFAEIKPA